MGSSEVDTRIDISKANTMNMLGLESIESHRVVEVYTPRARVTSVQHTHSAETFKLHRTPHKSKPKHTSRRARSLNRLKSAFSKKERKSSTVTALKILEGSGTLTNQTTPSRHDLGGTSHDCSSTANTSNIPSTPNILGNDEEHIKYVGGVMTNRGKSKDMSYGWSLETHQLKDRSRSVESLLGHEELESWSRCIEHSCSMGSDRGQHQNDSHLMYSDSLHPQDVASDAHLLHPMTLSAAKQGSNRKRLRRRSSKWHDVSTANQSMELSDSAISDCGSKSERRTITSRGKKRSTARTKKNDRGGGKGITRATSHGIYDVPAGSSMELSNTHHSRRMERKPKTVNRQGKRDAHSMTKTVQNMNTLDLKVPEIVRKNINKELCGSYLTIESCASIFSSEGRVEDHHNDSFFMDVVRGGSGLESAKLAKKIRGQPSVRGGKRHNRSRSHQIDSEQKSRTISTNKEDIKECEADEVRSHRPRNDKSRRLKEKKPRDGKEITERAVIESSRSCSQTPAMNGDGKKSVEFWDSIDVDAYRLGDRERKTVLREMQRIKDRRSTMPINDDAVNLVKSTSLEQPNQDIGGDNMDIASDSSDYRKLKKKRKETYTQLQKEGKSNVNEKSIIGDYQAKGKPSVVTMGSKMKKELSKAINGVGKASSRTALRVIGK